MYETYRVEYALLLCVRSVTAGAHYSRISEMLCKLSSKVPQEPVVSKHTGALFERRLIEKYIDEWHKCPLTGQPMTKNDLLTVSGGVGPATGLVGSIPNLLTALQSEWDSVMLEQFSLRQQLSQAHQELSHALYQHEASCRVIAKLMRERDILYAQLKERDPDAEIPQSPDNQINSLPKEITDEIDANMNRMKDQRHRRTIPRGLVSSDELAAFRESTALRTNSPGTLASGLLCLTLNTAHQRTLAVTGGSDGRVSCFDLNNKTLSSTLIGHTKSIRCVRCVDDIIFSGSDDSTIRLWKDTVSGYQGIRVLKAHRGPVIGFSILPSHRHLLSAGTDGRLAFTDFERGYTLASGEPADLTSGISCLGLHPDGMLAVTGSGGKVLIWDVKSMSVVLSKGDGSQGSITSVNFNEDGFTMAASTTCGVVKLYDLRNIDHALADLSPPGTPQPGQVSNSKALFSDDGSYLAVAGAGIQIWDWKANRDIVTLSSHSEPITDLAWGPDARWIASTSLDKTLRTFCKH